MENCPVCGSSVNTGDTSGLWSNKNVYLNDDVVQSINEKLPHDLQSDKMCVLCIDYTRWVNNGLVAKVNQKIYHLKSNAEKKADTHKDEVYLQLFNEAKKIVKCYTINVDGFHPLECVDSVIMFDSGARSTSADNLNAGIWNVINDSITLKLGDTKKVEEAIEAARSNIKLKALMNRCDTVVGISVTYSDLAANGKILLHMSGTAGYVKNSSLSDKALSLLEEFEKTDHTNPNNEAILDSLNELALDFKTHKFYPKKK